MLKMFPITLLGLSAAGVLLVATPASGQSTFDPAKVLKGMEAAPVPLNTTGKDPTLLGYGSYLVNGVADCNGCHSAGPPTQYSPGGSPYQGQQAVVNPATYLGGGRDFGAFPNANGNFAHIVSRNLTPDYTGMAAGGMTFDMFLLVMRTGTDFDHLHPNCTGAPDGHCIPAPFKGDLLQVMSWPTFSHMTDGDLQAIYTYLSAIPCLEGGPGEPANRCMSPVKTSAVAGPKNFTATSREVSLDGSASTAGDGQPLAYQWSIPQGSPSAAILHGNSVNPTVQFAQGRGVYTFLLMVTDSKGTSSTDAVMVNFAGN